LSFSGELIEQDEQVGDGSEPEEPVMVELENSKFKGLSNSVITRWGSVLIMAKRFLKNKGMTSEEFLVAISSVWQTQA
jgi:hypothetical protein